MTSNLELAQRLLREHKAGDRFRSTEPGVATLDDAYKVQADLVGLVKGDRNTSQAGYKIGLTSLRMQAMCGIDQPVAGVMFADSVHKTGATLALSEFTHLGLEFEIAVRLKRDLGPEEWPFDTAAIQRSVDAITPAIELIDDRHADYRSLDVKALVADNAWSAGLVVGEFHKAWPDLISAVGIVRANGEIVDQGFGRDVLGHPFNPLIWLANRLVGQQKTLRAGELISTGSLVTTRFPTIGGEYNFEIEGLGCVELRLQR